MGLWLLQTASAVAVPEKDIDRTVSVFSGTESVDLPCGEIDNPYAIEWRIKKPDGWTKILKIYKSDDPEYYEEYNADKYGISESADTAIKVKNIDASAFTSQLFRCDTPGSSQDYIYTTRVMVVGKSLFHLFFWNF